MNRKRLSRLIIQLFVTILWIGVMAVAAGQVPIMVYFFASVLGLCGLIGIGMSLSWAVQNIDEDRKI